MTGKIIKKTFKIALTLLGAIAVFALGFLLWAWREEWRPQKEEVVFQNLSSPELIAKDTLKIISWNIGYGGLGDNTDFFYDGGEMVQDSEARTRENLDSIAGFLKQHADADFILLQEIDLHSKRSYYIDEFKFIESSLPHHQGWMGLNYVSGFVPIPITDPIGEVKSGVAIFSKFIPQSVTRYQYPSEFGFPTRLFNLKRCLLSAVFATKWGELYVNNTHNTAYDTGGMRSDEFSFLKSFLSNKALSVSAGDWNSNPPHYVASEKELTDEHFQPQQIKVGELGKDISFHYDSSPIPTVRYGYEPYKEGQTTTSVLDFVATSARVEVISCETIDLGFRSSDHNPVVFSIRIF